MKCPFCAETIQDEAILCRFCGARSVNGVWRAPEIPNESVKPAGRRTNLTILVTGVLFLASAAWEIASIRSGVPLFGAVREGAAAAAYHILYASLFLAMGWGLYAVKPWGFRITLIGTLVYTIDKALYLLDASARQAELTRTPGYEDLMDTGMLDAATIHQWSTMLNLTLVACWWGFALYLFLRRGYFENKEA